MKTPQQMSLLVCTWRQVDWASLCPPASGLCGMRVQTHPLSCITICWWCGPAWKSPTVRTLFLWEMMLCFQEGYSHIFNIFTFIIWVPVCIDSCPVKPKLANIPENLWKYETEGFKKVFFFPLWPKGSLKCNLKFSIHFYRTVKPKKKTIKLNM